MKIQNKIKNRYLWILSVLFFSLFCGGQADAQEISATLNQSYSSGAAYYGSQLSTKNERRIYTILVSHSRKGKILGAGVQSNGILVNFADQIPENNSKKLEALTSEIGRALDAFLFDYSENYWVRGCKCNLIIKSGPSRVTGIRIWFTDAYNGIRTDKAEADRQLKNLYAGVNGKNRYEIVKDAYEDINRLVEYPPDSKVNHMVYHTVVSGLLSKYGHEGVCECYARLFQLVCQKKGIACLLVQGGSQVLNGEVYTDHIWNYVQMEDGKWYLVDCTWGDGGRQASSTYFLAGSSTAGLTGRTVGQEHMPTGRFSNMKYKSFHAPKLSATAYKSGETQAAAPKKVTLSAGSMKLTTGGREALTAKISPSAFPVDGLTWSSSNTKVADVTVMGSAGKVYITGKSAGTATITVSWKKKTLASCKVTVSKKAASVKYKIRLNAGTLPLQVKKSTTALKVLSITAGDGIKEWKSSNTAVVKVDKRTGKLTARKRGTAVITAVSRKGAKASCKVKVQKGQVTTGKLSLNKTSVELKKGESMTVKVTRTPLTATDKLTYRSSNPKIASANAKGKVTARKKGTVTITVRSAKGKTAKLKIKVK